MECPTRPTAPSTGAQPTKAPKEKYSYAVGSDADLEESVRNGTVVIARLKVFKQWSLGLAFATNTRFPCDVAIQGVENRGGAFHGDVVAVKLLSPNQWGPSPKKGKPLPHPDASGSAERTVEDAMAEAAETELSNNFGGDKGRFATKLPDGRSIANAIKERQSRLPAASEAPEARFARMMGAPDCFWDESLQPKGQVVRVLERPHSLFPVARLAERSMAPGEEIVGNRFYRFQSYSEWAPQFAVYGRDIPMDLRSNIGEHLLQLQVVITNGGGLSLVNNQMPAATVVNSIGLSSTVTSNSCAICSVNGVSMIDFSEEAYECVIGGFCVPSKEELAELSRRDLRDEEFVCTIDPATARDLDDGLSITRLPGGYRLGVHIADVSYYVPVNSALDIEAQERCNSTYLVEQVIPMLPRKLSEDYCSLNPGEDKYAFSVIMHLDSHGVVTSEWFGQTVIRNRCRMAYEDAQRIIDGDDCGDHLNIHELEVRNGTPREEIAKRAVESVKVLFELASKLRAKSLDAGRITLGNTKLSFIFDTMNSRLVPKGFRIARQHEANWVVEEFMVLANSRVAQKIVQFLPAQAMLRRHPPPGRDKIVSLRLAMEKHGFAVSGYGGRAFQKMLDECKDHKLYTAVGEMCKFAMNKAEYLANGAQVEDNFRAHFALATAWYTHFTSPIRRYCDVIVHRQLLLALEVEQVLKARAANGNMVAAAILAGSALAPDSAMPTPSAEDLIDPDTLEYGKYFYNVSDVENIATLANVRKENSRKVSDASLQLFLCTYLEALRRRSKVDPTISDFQQTEVVVVRLSPTVLTVYSQEIATEVSISFADTSQYFEIVKDQDAATGVESTEGPSSPPRGAPLGAHDPARAKNGAPKNSAAKAKRESDITVAVTWGVNPMTQAVEVEEIVLLKTMVASLYTTTRKGCLSLGMKILPPWERDSYYNGSYKFPTMLVDDGADSY